MKEGRVRGRLTEGVTSHLMHAPPCAHVPPCRCAKAVDVSRLDSSFTERCQRLEEEVENLRQGVRTAIESSGARGGPAGTQGRSMPPCAPFPFLYCMCNHAGGRGRM